MSETDTMDFIRHIKGNVSLVTWNALANVLGRLWSSLLSLLSIPIYIHILGAEAFGLIGFFSTFDIIFNFLDFGLSATVNREIARNVTTGADPQKNKVVLRTFESLYWVMGAAIGLVMFSSAGWLTRHWIHIKSLPPGDVQTALTIISFAFFARWPVSLYTGVLRGLQAQVLQNLILVVSSTVRVVGGIAIIIFVFPTIHGYALWYAFAAFLEILLISLTAWNRLNRLTGAAASFDWSVFKNTWNFAFTFNLVGVIGMVVSSADRVVISKLLPLDQLGYYSIAGTATGIMPLISIALMTALFPRFVGQLTQDGQTLFLSFRESVGFLSYVSAGLTFVLIFYAREILWIWTRSDITVTNVYQPLIFLAIANMLNAISNAPYTLLVANGQTRALLVG
ncbi:hypothetical protein EHM76_03610, partial [bacterium]